ncbi:MAG: enoyl-CoA hydratase/isomerase family protein [Armatimonadetes bacterium]|nr:enoyl-CoA hydratase/isomerase family protein [Anaerolineae bacterium]
MSNPTLLVTQRDAVTTITFNAPEVRNAIDYNTMVQLRQAVEACTHNGTRCIIITGASGAEGAQPAFCSGLNIKRAIADGMTPDNVYKGLTESFHPAMHAIRSAPMPVIAAVDGYAAGFGCDIALSCDLRLVTERARFGELFIRMGLVPDGGGTYLLPRLVGLGRALELMFTGRDVLSDEAVRIGLANHIIRHEVFEDEVFTFASDLARKSPEALRRGKAAMLGALDGDYRDALLHEAQHQRDILASDDGMEGFSAFLQKREPVWTTPTQSLPTN